MTKSLLPPNATALEHAADAAMARIADVNVPIADLWNPDLCPEAVLPWLAWALSVEPWDADWPIWQQRQVINASIPTHRIKGTVAAIRSVLTAAGFGAANILEQLHRPGRNGLATRNGHYVHGDPKAWATYRIVLDRPITNLQAAFVRSLLAESDRAVSYLAGLDYTAVANIHNGAITRDGSFNHGVA